MLKWETEKERHERIKVAINGAYGRICVCKISPLYSL